MGKILGILVALVLGIALITFAIGLINQSRVQTVQESPVEETTPKGNPRFTWDYTTSEKDGIPQTAIAITANYPDGSTARKIVDVVEGSCNDYTQSDSDVYPDSTMIICYYAGLGRYYKVMASNGAYLVQRRVFEEASPDYNPPVTGYETVVSF